MRHRLFTILSALSLLLCVAAVTAWVCGFHRTHGPITTIRGGVYTLGVHRVGIGFTATTFDSARVHAAHGLIERPRYRVAGLGLLIEHVDHHELVGFETLITSNSSAGDTFTLDLPFWLLILLLSILPLSWLLIRRRRRDATGFPVEPSPSPASPPSPPT